MFLFISPQLFKVIRILSLVTTTGVFIGAAIWWYILTSVVNTFRSSFRLKQLWWINKISGAVIFVLGAIAILGMVRLLYS
jgi:hypothetical protein